MSALGGPSRKVSDLSVSFGISWSPDGRYINAARMSPKNGIYRIPVQGGEPVASLRPTAAERVERPSFSPDGRFLAYASCQEPSRCFVQIVEVDAAFAAHGPPRRLTRHPAFRIDGITWSRDGQFLVYAAYLGAQNLLWRVAVDGQRPEQRIEIAGLNARAPKIIASGDLVFSRRHRRHRRLPCRARASGCTCRAILGFRRQSALLARWSPIRLLLGAIGRCPGDLDRGVGRIGSASADT